MRFFVSLLLRMTPLVTLSHSCGALNPSTVILNEVKNLRVNSVKSLTGVVFQILLGLLEITLFQSFNKPGPYQADKSRQQKEPSQHIHGEDDKQLVAHLSLKTERREGPEGDPCRDEKSSVENCLSRSGYSLDEGCSKIRLLLTLILLDGAGDDIDAVVNTETDPQADDRQGVDIQANVPEGH